MDSHKLDSLTPESRPDSQPSPAADKPRIGITMGDPAGIGPEVVAKALADPDVRRLGRFIIFGLHEPFAYAADLAEINPYWFREPHDNVRLVQSGAVVADFDEITNGATYAARPTAIGGVASMRFLEEAIVAVQEGRLDALVTGPINKIAWKLAGYAYTGHTTLLAKRFRTRRVAMMMVGGPLRVALASIHEPLFELRNSFTIGRVFTPIDLLDKALREDFGLESPRIGVCGLNPHAGEGGRFGDEEARIIQPAITMAREAGCLVEGPFPADTLFLRAARGEYAGVVAMYHDQGLIPVKLLAFNSAVNVTLGLPIVRTSVDHGTAYDIAGKNRADPGSMQSAIRLACHLATHRLQEQQAAQTSPSAQDPQQT